MKQQGAQGVNLLPLLDVLLCTMGTLIVILGVVNRQVRLQAHSDPEEAAIAREQIELQTEQLTTARQKTLADLDMARRRLSGIEEHSRQLTDQLRELGEAAKRLNQQTDPNGPQQQALRAELARLHAERARLDEELKHAREAALHQKPCFAVIPFDGIHKTNRRPIYIECRADCIILQPEGIVLTADDFRGPSGPGNPLASALRAAREYWTQVPTGTDTPNEPYPLLLVRPDGVVAYYLAREAMASWGSEFGYEVIDADWKLDFPSQPDERLVEAERRAIDEARQRLQWLAQASPESFSRRPHVQYRVSPLRGGVVRDGGPSLGNDPFADDPLGGFGRRPVGFGSGGAEPGGRGERYGDGQRYGGSGENGGGFYADGGSDALATARGRSSESPDARGTGIGSGDGRYADGLSGDAASGGGRYRGSQYREDPYGNGSGSESDGISGEGRGSHAAGSMPGGASAHAVSASHGAFGQAGGSVGDRYAGGSAQGRDASASSNHSGSDVSDAASSVEGGSGDAGVAGESCAAGQSSSSSTGATGPMSSMDPSDPTQAIPSPTFNMSPQNARDRRTASRSVAADRGRNWAMPHTGAAVPITRPIRVACSHDRLVVVPDSRDQQEQAIPLAEQTRESVDQLVAAVRQYTKSWGIAGRGMYWKPQLVLEVAPTGAARADDLQILLADSGLDVRRK